MVARHILRPRPPGTRPEGRRRLAAAVVLIGLAAAACSGGDDGGGAAATTAQPGGSPPGTTAVGAASTSAPADSAGSAAVLGPSASSAAPTTTYVVPDIPPTSVAEICAGTKQITAADDKIAELLGPALALDASPEADQQLIAALSQVKPLIDEAQAGYDRMAAALPGELATDAATVRDATLTFYGAVSASVSMEVLQATVSQARAYTDAAREAAARLDATTRKTCNLSLYNSEN